MRYTFGSDVSAGAFIEDMSTPAPQDADTPPPLRPMPGVVLTVRDYVTREQLPDIISADFGTWSYTTDDRPVIEISGDGGTTWMPQIAAEWAVASALAPRLWPDPAAVDSSVRDGDVLIDRTGGTPKLSARVSGQWVTASSGTSGGLTYDEVQAQIDASIAGVRGDATAGGTRAVTADEFTAAMDTAWYEALDPTWVNPGTTSPTTGTTNPPPSTGGTTTTPSTSISYSTFVSQSFDTADGTWNAADNVGTVTMGGGYLTLRADATKGANRQFDVSTWPADKAVRIRVVPKTPGVLVGLGVWCVDGSWQTLIADGVDPSGTYEFAFNMPPASAGAKWLYVTVSGEQGKQLDVDSFFIDFGATALKQWRIPAPSGVLNTGAKTLVKFATNSPFTKTLPSDVPRHPASVKLAQALRDQFPRDAYQPTFNYLQYGIGDVFSYNSTDPTTYDLVKMVWRNHFLWDWVPAELYGPTSWSYTFAVDPNTADEATKEKLRDDFVKALVSDPASPYNKPSDPNALFSAFKRPKTATRTQGTDGPFVFTDTDADGGLVEGWLLQPSTLSPCGETAQQMSVMNDTAHSDGVWYGDGKGSSASRISLGVTAASTRQYVKGGDFGHMLAIALTACLDQADSTAMARAEAAFGMKLQRFYYPASHTDGNGKEYPYLLPQGLVFAIEPTWVPQPGEVFHDVQLALIRTVQRYGMVINDTTGNGLGMQACNEALKTAQLGHNPWLDVCAVPGGQPLGPGEVLTGRQGVYSPFPWYALFAVHPNFYLEEV